jgi:2-polyprenyl-6-methoxyphenol hydroxylase-like FAD-dependent oxidoreductase
MENSTTNEPLGEKIRVCIVGAGTIGLSFVALHLSQRQNVEVTIHDTRPELEAYVYENLSGKLSFSIQFQD